MARMVISGFWLCVASALFGVGVVLAFASYDKATAIALFGILAVMISSWIKE